MTSRWLTILATQTLVTQVLWVGVRILAGLIAVALAPNQVVLVLAAATAGAGSVTTFIGQQTMVAARSAVGRRTGNFSTLTTAASVGQLIAPLVVTGGLASAVGANWGIGTISLAVAGGVALAVALTSVWITPRPERTPDGRTASPKLPAHRLVRLSQMGRSLSTSATVLVTVDLLYMMLPLWAAERDVTAGMLGTLLTLRAAVSVLSRLALSRVVDHAGVRSVLSVALTLGVVALVMLAVAPTWTAWIALTLLGVALGAPQPLTMAWTVGLAPTSAQGAALGLRQWTNRAGQVVLPMAAGPLLAPAGFAGFAVLNAGLMAGAVYLVATAHFPRGRLPDPRDD